jgi:hypothetical protein
MALSLLIAMAKLGALVFLPPAVLGFLVGRLRPATAPRRAAVPGWAWYLAIEVAVLIDKRFPLLWANLADMVPLVEPPLALVIAAGVAGGAVSLYFCGRAAAWGFRVAARHAATDVDPSESTTG